LQDEGTGRNFTDEAAKCEMLRQSLKVGVTTVCLLRVSDGYSSEFYLKSQSVPHSKHTPSRL
jgi:hypothetical protein